MVRNYSKRAWMQCCGWCDCEAAWLAERCHRRWSMCAAAFVWNTAWDVQCNTSGFLFFICTSEIRANSNGAIIVIICAPCLLVFPRLGFVFFFFFFALLLFYSRAIMFCIGARPRLFGCIRLLFLLNMPQEKEALTREIPVAIKSNPENEQKKKTKRLRSYWCLIRNSTRKTYVRPTYVSIQLICTFISIFTATIWRDRECGWERGVSYDHLVYWLQQASIVSIPIYVDCGRCEMLIGNEPTKPITISNLISN